MNLVELGGRVRAKRLQTGLSQGHLAKLTGLSRVTINQLENGTLKDLGYSKLKTVFDVLGVDMQIQQSDGVRSALAVAARTVSTSYRDVLTPEMLSEILRSGMAPDRYHPHLMTLLDETPLPIVVKAIAEASTSDTPAKKIMKHLTRWAHEWKTRRMVWS